MLKRDLYIKGNHRGTVGDTIGVAGYAIGDLIKFSHEDKTGVGIICRNEETVAVMGYMHIPIFKYRHIEKIIPHELVTNEIFKYRHGLDVVESFAYNDFSL